MLVTLGESFTISGRCATRLAVPTTSSSDRGIAAKLNAAMRGVGAGNIQFISRDAVAFIQHADHLLIIFAEISEYIGENDNVLEPAQLGQLFFDEGAHPHILQPDRIQHSRRRFEEARRLDCRPSAPSTIL